MKTTKYLLALLTSVMFLTFCSTAFSKTIKVENKFTAPITIKIEEQVEKTAARSQPQKAELAATNGKATFNFGSSDKTASTDKDSSVAYQISLSGVGGVSPFTVKWGVPYDKFFDVSVTSMNTDPKAGRLFGQATSKYDQVSIEISFENDNALISIRPRFSNDTN